VTNLLIVDQKLPIFFLSSRHIHPYINDILSQHPYLCTLGINYDTIIEEIEVIDIDENTLF